MRKILVILLAALAIICTACNPPLPTVPPTQTAQASGSTVVEGDSLTFQAILGGGAVPQLRHAGLGWTAVNCIPAQNPGCLTPRDHIEKKVREGQADRVVWALGSNDAHDRNGGWTIHDELYWTDSLDALPSSSCIVMVTAYGVSPMASTTLAQYEEANAWMRSFAAGRPNTFVMDWAGYARLGPDGLHLEPDPNGAFGISRAAADARAQIYNDGLAQCTGGA